MLWEFEKVVERHVNRQETLLYRRRPFQKPDSRKLEETVMGHTNHHITLNLIIIKCMVISRDKRSEIRMHKEGLFNKEENQNIPYVGLIINRSY